MKALFTFLVLLSFTVKSQYNEFPELKIKTLFGKEINQKFFDNGTDPSIIIFTSKGCGYCEKQIDTVLAHKEWLEKNYNARVIIILQNFFKDQNMNFEELKLYAQSKNWDAEVYLHEEGKFLNSIGYKKLPVTIYSFNQQMQHSLSGAKNFKATKIILKNYSGNKKWYNEKWQLTLPGVHKFYRETTPIQGDSLWGVKDFYSSGIIQMSGCYSSMSFETKEGKFEWFNEDGSLNKKSEYQNGILNGVNQRWNKEGKLTLDEYYKSGNLDSLITYYYPNGNLWSTQEYKDGKRWNVLFTYNKNQDSINFGSIKNGNGTYINYTEEGTVKKQMNYKDGKLFGITKCYNPKGEFLGDTYYDELGSRDYTKEYEVVSKSVSNALIKQDLNEIKSYLLNNKNIDIVAEKELSDELKELVKMDKESFISSLSEQIQKQLKKVKIDVIQKHGLMINQLNYSSAKRLTPKGLNENQRLIELVMSDLNTSITLNILSKRINDTFYIIENITLK